RCAFSGAPKGETGLDRDGFGFRAFGRRLEGTLVVACERAGDLVFPATLEVARRGQVSRAPVAPAQRRIRDLPNDRLHETELPAFGRAWIGVEDEDVAPDQVV